MSSLDLLTANDVLGEYPASYYATDKTTHARASLEGDLDVDVAIIGGGLTGLAAAKRLALSGKSVAVLEASRVGFGASGRNGGQIGQGQRIDQHAIEKMVGLDRAKVLFDIGNRAAHMAREIAGDRFQKGVAHACLAKREVREEHAYVRHLQDVYDYDGAEILDADSVREHVNSDAYLGGAVDWNAGHADPLAMALRLAEEAEVAGAVIYENTRVLSLDPVRTENGQLRAQNVILALNGYHNDLDPETAKYVMPINNFIVATEPLGELAKELMPQNTAVADSKFVVNYFRRSTDDRLLFGGGESYGYQFPKDLSEKARAPMCEIFPALEGKKIDFAWGGTLGITMNRLPYVRQSGNRWVSGGYSGHGLALSIFCGDMIGRAILGDDEDFNAMSSIPHKAFPGGASLRRPLLVGAMLWYQLRDKLRL